MVNMLVYVNRATCDIINLGKREEIICDRACALSEDTELFEEFLAKHYRQADLLRFCTRTATSIYLDFFSECRSMAEKEFEENYVEKTVMIEE